jgi:hypothetical protein
MTRRRLLPWLRVWCFAAGALASAGTHGLIIGQTDDFEDGTTGGWLINLLGFGSPPPQALPTNIPTGGPAGSGDNYLQLGAVGGLGAGSRLVALNGAQWAGNYLATGITAITMAVNNFGDTDLLLRLLFENPMGAPPTDVALSTVPVSVPAHSGWMSVVFPITIADLTAETGSVASALSTTTFLRIFHNPQASFGPNGPPPIAATLGVDNIAAIGATSVPEPATALLVIGALMLAGVHHRASSRCRDVEID